MMYRKYRFDASVEALSDGRVSTSRPVTASSSGTQTEYHLSWAGCVISLDLVEH